MAQLSDLELGNCHCLLTAARAVSLRGLGPTMLTWPLSLKVKEVEFGGNITRLKVAGQPSGNLLLDFLKEQRMKQRFAPQRKHRTQASWDKLHHVTFSKDNSVYSSYVREYFDRPRVPNDTFYNM
ncbi:hypothetical protein FOZ62_024306, partial [Perkinsus olseni]